MPVVIPTRGATGKGRLRPPPGVSHTELARAVAMDTMAAAAACPRVSGVIVVSADPAMHLPAPWRGLLVPDPGLGLRAAIDAGLAVTGPGVPGPGAVGPPDRVAILLGDLAALRPEELDAALAAAAAVGDAAFVPDAEGTGTVLLCGPVRALRPAFGPGSAAAHAHSAVRLDLDLPGLRRDVDDARDLAEALRLGVGVHTRAAMAPGASGRQAPP